MYVVIYIWLNKQFFRTGPGVCRYIHMAKQTFFRIGSGVCRYLHMAKQTVLQNRTWGMSLFTYG